VFLNFHPKNFHKLTHVLTVTDIPSFAAAAAASASADYQLSFSLFCVL